MKRLAAQDRQALIRLASSLRPGSSARRAILAGLTKRSNERDSYRVTLEKASKFPLAVKELEEDWLRKQITAGEKMELYVGIGDAKTERQAMQVVTDHRKMRGR